jgi:transposase
VRDLAQRGAFQPELFDKYGLAETTDKAYPGERLIICYNPLLAEQRKRKRSELLAATQTELDKLVLQVRKRTKTPLKAGEIGQKAGRLLTRHKMAKHHQLHIEDGKFSWQRDEENIRREEQTDGIYIIRTNESAQQLGTDDAVRTYKSLGQVEQAFRNLKSLDLLIRPIRHRDETHVKAHIFLNLLAYHVQWHMRKALAPVLFEDEHLDEHRWQRHPVQPAQPSQTAKDKKLTHQTQDGWPVHSFGSLLKHLATLCRNTCSTGTGPTCLLFEQDTQPTPFQSHVFDLLKNYIPPPCAQ